MWKEKCEGRKLEVGRVVHAYCRSNQLMSKTVAEAARM